MRFNFASQFIKLLPPDTNFGEAWETLCFILLCEENGYDEFVRLGAPDRGVDILHRTQSKAYQCKATENGCGSTISHSESMKSLETAVNHKNLFDWKHYCFATNANFSGVGFGNILTCADQLGIDRQYISQLGPEYWNSLCEKHYNKIADRFDYRYLVSEEDVKEALKKARYYDTYIAKSMEHISKSNFKLIITNNRTPIEISIPFSQELTVENYLDVAKSLLGLKLDWTNFDDIGTSAGPSLSVTIDGYSQPFSKKIAELPVKSGDKLQLWIKIVWRDEPKDDGISTDKTPDIQLRYHLSTTYYCKKININDGLLVRKQFSESSRKELTLSRQEEILQSYIWDNVGKFGKPMNERN